MSEETRKDTLGKMDFFQEFTDQHLGQLAAISRDVEFRAHHKIFQEHGLAKSVYLIVSGKVSLAICAPKIGCRQIMQASPGDLIGWSPLLGRPRFTDAATTLSPTEAIVFDGAELLKLCDQDRELGYQFMRRTAQVLAERLGATRVQLFNACGMNLPRVPMDSD